MLKTAALLGFLLLEVVLLTVMLAVGVVIYLGLFAEPLVYQTPLLYPSELLRALGMGGTFMVVSGYIVTAPILSALFRNDLLSLERAASLAVLFLLHAVVFIFYLMGPAIFTSGMLMIAIGVACIFAVTGLEYFLWRRWVSRNGT